ncbi:DNA binding domain-containing protein, excisionase family [Micrococcales bacterium KH10]|nr:DNA binding domain-containing protein, excisionase family [Micrococcales bacterium KH10]
MTTPLLMDAATAAKVLDPTMSPKTLLRLARSGQIASRRRGRLVRFAMEDLEAYKDAAAKREDAAYKLVPTRKKRL